MKITCFADEISAVLYEQVEVLHSLNIKWLEFRSAWEISVLDMNDHQLRDVHHYLNQEGIQVSCIGSSVGKLPITSDMKEAQLQMERAIRAADILETENIRGFTFYPEHGQRDEWISEVIRREQGLAEMAAKAGKIYLIESEHTVIADTSSRLQTVLDGVNHPSCQAVMDSSNLRSVGEKPFDESLPRLLPYINYLHIKDSLNETNEKVLPGQGDAQLALVLDALRSRDLFLSLEPHLSRTGILRGYSGKEKFSQAANALFSMLNELGIHYE